MTNLPRWVALHKSYYARFNEGIFQQWEGVLSGELGADGDLLLRAVEELIRSCFKGYTEDHFAWLQRYVVDHAPACPLCRGAGLVTVPYRGTVLDCKEYRVLCACPRGKRKALTLQGKTTLAQYEAKYGTEWRMRPETVVTASAESCQASYSLRAAFDALRRSIGNGRRNDAGEGVGGTERADGFGAGASGGSGVGGAVDWATT